jgi:pimeloyl-ACP methyl ester carboxylesterase
MTTFEIVAVICVAALVVLVIGNLVFSRLAERKNPPIGSFMECDGVRLHYVDGGKVGAPCIVLFHGNGSMIQDLIISGLVELLTPHNRVVCFDRPGFGYSKRPHSRIWTATAQADLFVKALDQLGVRNPVILGHSWGTLVAIAFGLQTDYPIRGLVLASGYYFPTWRWDVWIMAGPAIPIFGDLVRYTVAPIISWATLPMAFRKLFEPRLIPPKFKNGFPSSLTLRPKQLRAAAEETALMIPTATQFQFRYQSIRCPVQIFHGTSDQVIESEQSKRLHQVLASAELHMVRDAGHMVTYGDTATIAQAAQTLAATASLRLEIAKQDAPAN